jgi:spore germination protein YaaH
MRYFSFVTKFSFFAALALAFWYTAHPTQVEAASTVKSPIEVYGWIPYWRTATGTADAMQHLSTFTQLSPFGFTLKSDGTLFDAANLTQEPWTSLIAAAKKKKIKIIPTVMNGDGHFMHAILSDPKRRVALEDEIAAMVKERGYDGIDIDFEGKLAETRPYFATFLKGLYQRMGNKWVYCSIEARTPLSSRYDTIPKDIEYANDFVAINKYCDRVNIMAYDQGTIDLRLNEVQTGPYIPVADTKWVEKVVKEAAKTISKKKIMIGVATYGYEYEVTPLSISGYRYDRLWAFNPRYATAIAASFNLTPLRNSAGELSLMYMPTSTLPMMPTNPDVGGPTSNTTSATTSFSDGASMPAAPVVQMPMHILSWSDSKAIAEKVALARKLGVRGVAVFKIDGGEDPDMWKVLK